MSTADHPPTLRRPPALPPGRFVALPGRGRVFVREQRGGGRPTVVALHGWAATADLNWGWSFGPLGERFDVVAPDLRGHGRGLRIGERFTLEACADDIAALIDELDVGPTIVAGYSMGGPVAQLVWRRHPSLVAGLVLCATSQVFSDSTRDRALFAAAGGLATVIRARPARSVGRVVGQLAGRRRLPAWAVDQVLRHDWVQVAEAGRAIGRFDSRPWLGRIDVPVATVTTLADDVVPTHRQLDLAGALPLVGDHRVEGGHSVCLQPGSGFVPALIAACADVATAGAALARAA